VARDTLIDVFHDFTARQGTFLVYDDGYRTDRWSYEDFGRAARQFAARLEHAALRKGDKVLFWSENRPEWLIAFWGCLLQGVVVVPIDYRASAAFLHRVRAIVNARVALVGREPDRNGLPTDLVVWELNEIAARGSRLAAGDLAVGGSRLAAGDAGLSSAQPIARDDVAEIIFTSGATAEPKGVIITHGNVLANIVPVEREVVKYRTYARPFTPIRFLNLLPLSHMFGQAMATFIPPILGGTVVFMHGYSPAEIVRQVKTRRISVLVSVPKVLDVLREHVKRLFLETREAPATKSHWLRRWWRYRRVHRAFGWKFWCAVVGAAPLEPDLEEFWSRLGFLVVQGYGLTETAPIVTLNHPLSARKGSVGKPIAGVEVRIAEDGEILVRGDNVTRGYIGGNAEDARAFEDGWLHTGDIGGFDAEGRLFIRGRKKEMIVTPEGLNVFPEDVERALNTRPGVREAAVVGRREAGEERVHAVMVLAPDGEGEAVVSEANRALADHQRIRSYSIWPDDTLPRTEGTRKLRRREIKQWVDRSAGGSAEGPPVSAPARGQQASLESIVARFAPHRPAPTSSTSLEELGLTSLERVELMMALEEQFQTTIDEAAFASARTIGDLAELVAPPDLPHAAGVSTTAAAPPGAPSGELVAFPSWNRRPWASAIRRLSLPTWILPLGRVFAWVNVKGREHLDTRGGPVIFASNHQSHLDTPVVLMALPPRYRYRTAVAMAKEFFKAHFFPESFGRREWFLNSLNYYLAALFFNAFPLPQREAGTRHALRYIGELVDSGWSVLIFPEGKRTDRGEINLFRAGVGMIGARLRVPVIPVRLTGVHQVLHQRWKFPRPGSVGVTFGPALHLEGDDYADLAKKVEDAVRALEPDEPALDSESREVEPGR
jgi:long-chain acyl-CoA synthetase